MFKNLLMAIILGIFAGIMYSGLNIIYTTSLKWQIFTDQNTIMWIE